jgi:hypothetical protein
MYIKLNQRHKLVVGRGRMRIGYSYDHRSLKRERV